MKHYDILVIGSGVGMGIVSEALAHDKKVALVDKGPIGGTCPNLGCIPSKMLIHAADRVVEAAEAKKVGVSAAIEQIDFLSIMERMREYVRNNQSHMRNGLSRADGLDYYDGIGHFVDEYTMEVGGQKVRAERVFIASGSRPFIPPIKGLDSVEYLTNESVLQLTKCPESLIIIGGGYIAVEYGHFFAAMGSKVTVLEMADRLITSEEPEVSLLLQQQLSERMEVHTGSQVQEVKRTSRGVSVFTSDVSGNKRYSARSLLVAVGRRSNADLLKVENTGVEVDSRGWVKVNEYLETTKRHIYAVGDANGKQMFTHVGNVEAALAADSAVHGTRLKMDYTAAPHAVYSHPQIASVGMKEEEARQGHQVLVGRARYFDVAQGQAIMEEKGFAKAIVEADTEKILGFHIIGPYAPILIQEVTNVMAHGGSVGDIGRGMHIHPSITELVPRVMAELS